MKKYGLIFMLVGLLLASCSQQEPVETFKTQSTNYWKKLGDALDIVPKHNVAKAKLILDRNGRPVIVWAEDNGLWYLQAKRWNGSSWEKLPLPTKPLPYDDYGVNDFDVAFDSSNVMVVSQVIQSVSLANYQTVEIYRTASSKWVQLASFEGAVQLQTNAKGQVHALFAVSVNDTISNVIKRWDGSTWRTVATFQKANTWCDEVCYTFFASVNSFEFKSNGQLVIRWNNRYSMNYSNYVYSSWDGKVWTDIAESPLDASQMKIDKNNKLVYAVAGRVSREGVGILGQPDDIGYSYDFDLAVDTANRPLVASSLTASTQADIDVKRWTGTKWQKLGGFLDRTLSKNASTPQLLVGTDGTYYMAWLEAACANAATCGGANLYVSKYVP